jgi:hypothetical protein
MAPSLRAFSSLASSSGGANWSRDEGWLLLAGDGSAAAGGCVLTPAAGGWLPALKLWPQLKQNLAPAGSSVPQLGQACASFVPQFEQNFADAGFSVWQLGQFITPLHKLQLYVPGNCIRAQQNWQKFLGNKWPSIICT